MGYCCGKVFGFYLYLFNGNECGGLHDCFGLFYFFAVDGCGNGKDAAMGIAFGWHQRIRGYEGGQPGSDPIFMCIGYYFGMYGCTLAPFDKGIEVEVYEVVETGGAEIVPCGSKSCK